MAKAILVLNEMPMGCEYCPCNHEWECGALNRRLESRERPAWCPLRQLPDRRVAETNSAEWLQKLIDDAMTVGWNACLNAIGGGEDE